MDKLSILLIMGLFLSAGFAQAISVDSVTVDEVSPGEEGIIRINVENEGNTDVERLSFSLGFPNNSGIIPLGSSEAFVRELKEDDDETFAFRFKVSNALPAGTYSIPYTINYEEGNEERMQQGVIGVVVSAEPEIEVVADIENPIIGRQGTLNIRLVNKGLADARFVSVSVDSEEITFLSEKNEYIGIIDSDDFEIASFDIIPNARRPNLEIRVEYKDFGNNDQQLSRITTLKAYTEEQALSLGLISRNNTALYIIIAVAVLLIWYFWRRARKKRKNKEIEE